MNGVAPSEGVTDDIQVRRKFVRSADLDLSAKQLVEKAILAGIVMNEKFVWTERTAMRKEQNKPIGKPVSEETKFIRTQGLNVPVETVISRAEVKGLTISRKQVWSARGRMKVHVLAGKRRVGKGHVELYLQKDAPVKKTPRKAARMSKSRVPKHVLRDRAREEADIRRRVKEETEQALTHAGEVKLPVEMSVTHEFFRLLAAEIGLSRAMEILQEQKDKLIAHIKQAAE